MKITIDLGRAPWELYQRVAAFTFHSLQAHFPDLETLEVSADRPDPHPFDIPAHDYATGRDVDDTNGQPIDPPHPPAPPADPHAEVKARVQDSIKRLVEALGERGIPVTFMGPYALKCAEPDCEFCNPTLN